MTSERIEEIEKTLPDPATFAFSVGESVGQCVNVLQTARSLCAALRLAQEEIARLKQERDAAMAGGRAASGLTPRQQADAYRRMAEAIDDAEFPPVPWRRIVLDFDGTLAEYFGWAKNGTKPGKPIGGAVEWVKGRVAEGYQVMVATARKDLDGVRSWLAEAGFPPMLVVSKPSGIAYPDDRAVRFRGSWDEITEAVTAEPWWKRDA